MFKFEFRNSRKQLYFFLALASLILTMVSPLWAQTQTPTELSSTARVRLETSTGSKEVLAVYLGEGRFLIPVQPLLVRTQQITLLDAYGDEVVEVHGAEFSTFPLWKSSSRTGSQTVVQHDGFAILAIRSAIKLDDFFHVAQFTSLQPEQVGSMVSIIHERGNIQTEVAKNLTVTSAGVRTQTSYDLAQPGSFLAVKNTDGSLAVTGFLEKNETNAFGKFHHFLRLTSGHLQSLHREVSSCENIL